MQEDTPLFDVIGVGPKRAELFRKQLNVDTVGELLAYYPYKYVDRSRFYTVSECVDDTSYIQLRGVIRRFETRGMGNKERLIATFADNTGSIELVWFKGLKYITQSLKVNTDYIVFGKPTRFGSIFNIAHPEIDPCTDANLNRIKGLQAFYNTTEVMKRSYLTSEAIRKVILSILGETGHASSLQIRETLPEELTNRLGLLPRDEAIRQIHKPTDNETLKRAQFRLKFEELFYIQVFLLQSAQLRTVKYQGFRFSRVGECFNNFYSNYLSFPLTNAQKRVIKEIRRDMNTGRQMNRLLQGDVGSGKTMVALLTALIAIDNGYQVAIMAPTEILANQHYETIRGLLLEMNFEDGARSVSTGDCEESYKTEHTPSLPGKISVELLTGSVKGKRRNQVLEGLRDGSVNIIIGTHALIEDTVVFRNLGYAVIDEQHRFGVAQRAKLWTKNTLPPHILVMTATPIPRTLAMTVYGDLEVSIIDELPPGRKPVATYHFFDNGRGEMNRFLHAQIAEGRQVYVVYPLVKESEKLDLRNAEEGFVQMIESFPECKVVMVHGQMKNVDKDIAMAEFVSGRAKIMVATTVIEVGVNVPNASVMVIENAERFGLSQLHQLRGRVGRGAEQSFCILMSRYELARETRQRLNIMCRTNDGFEIAEEDMRLRGPGDMEGLKQSGLPFDLHIASLATDGLILNMARDEAKKIIALDPEFKSNQYRVVGERLAKIKNTTTDWGAIS